jgi:hypothetical protein
VSIEIATLKELLFIQFEGEPKNQCNFIFWEENLNQQLIIQPPIINQVKPQIINPLQKPIMSFINDDDFNIENDFLKKLNENFNPSISPKFKFCLSNRMCNLTWKPQHSFSYKFDHHP